MCGGFVPRFHPYFSGKHFSPIKQFTLSITPMKTIEAMPVFEGYTEVNGTYYRVGFPAPVIKALEAARANGREIRVYFGDLETGRDWNETNDVKGIVGRSMGPCKIPLLVKNGKIGGGALISSIVRIRYADSDRDLYRHPSYNCGAIKVQESNEKGYSHSVTVNGEIYSNHKSQKSAHLMAAKLL